MYLPKNKIKPNLYTNGGEFINSQNNLPYVGYYWQDFRGLFFAGKTPNYENSPQLIKIDTPTLSETDSFVIIDNTYNKLTNIGTDIKSPIKTYYPSPTDSEYQIGEFQRYFCKKTNNNIYIEIDKSTFDNLENKNPIIPYYLYIPFEIPWKISGDKSQVYKTNKNIVDLVSKQNKLPGFSLYIKDYLRFYK